MSDNQAPRIRTFRNELPTHTHTRPQALPSIYNIPKLPELPEPTTTTSSTHPPTLYTIERGKPNSFR